MSAPHASQVRNRIAAGLHHAIALRFLYLYANARQQTESRGADVSGTRLTIDRLALITTKMLVFDDAPTAMPRRGAD